MHSLASVLARWSPAQADRVFSTALEKYSSGDYALAIAELLALAKHDHAAAQALLGHIYHRGEGVGVNHKEAARWTQLAAEKGVPEAQFNIGVMYEDGIGIPKDITAALRWYRLAAQWGVVGAQINLSHCFHNGIGVDQDESLAAWWARLAADQGDVESQLNLGTRYLNAIGVLNDIGEAYCWFHLAATAGNHDAISYRANAIRGLTPKNIQGLEELARSLTWTPKSPSESALDIFKSAAFQNIDALKRTLGEEAFGELKTTDRKPPSAGELILSETHGVRPITIASNIRQFLADLDRDLDLKLGAIENAQGGLRGTHLTPRTALELIRRIDDVADVGTIIGEEAAKFTHNLLEFHLSLIREMEAVDLDTVTMLLKRFSLREALRAPGLLPYAGLQNVPLPLLPW